MISAIIFDVDGLMVDSEPIWDNVRKQFASELGKNWTSADHKAVMGSGTKAWLEYMTTRLELKISNDELQKIILTKMQQSYKKEIPFMQGALAAVALANAHFPTAIASGSPKVLLDEINAHPEIKGKFDVVISADLVNSGKPAPDIYLKAAELLNIPPQNCLCLEDSENGILAGVRAGMKVIAVPDYRFSPNPAVLAQANVVINTLDEFTLDLIKSIN